MSTLTPANMRQVIKHINDTTKTPIPDSVAKVLNIFVNSSEGRAEEVRSEEMVEALQFYADMMVRDELKFHGLPINWGKGAKMDPLKDLVDGAPLSRNNVSLIMQSIYWPIMQRKFALESLATYGIAVHIVPDHAHKAFDLFVEDMKGRSHLIARGDMGISSTKASFLGDDTSKMNVFVPSEKNVRTLLSHEAKERLANVFSKIIFTLPMPYEMIKSDNPKIEAHRKMYYERMENISNSLTTENRLPVPCYYAARTVAAQIAKIDRGLIPHLLNATRQGPTFKTMVREAKEILGGANPVATKEALLMTVNDKLSTRAIDPKMIEMSSERLLTRMKNEADGGLELRAKHLVETVMRSGGMINPAADDKMRHTKFSWRKVSAGEKKSTPVKSEAKVPKVEPTRERFITTTDAPVAQEFNNSGTVSSRIMDIFKSYGSALSVEQLAKKILEAACPDEIIPMDAADITAVQNTVYNMKTHPTLASHSVHWLSEFIHEKRAQKPAAQPYYRPAPETPKHDISATQYKPGR